MKHTYTVTGMTCIGCKASVEKALASKHSISEKKETSNLKQLFPLFLMRVQIPLTLIITLIILGITTIGVKTLLDKKSIQCAFLGTALKLPMTKATFIENSIMNVMTVLMLLNMYSS